MCVWREDADSIKYGEDSLNILYKNRIIADYLSSNRKLGIAGTKGQGKTFLLKIKRNMYQNVDEWKNDDGSIVCFPKDRMVDTLDSSIAKVGTSGNDFTINKSINGCLKDFNVWVQLWKLSIAMTVISSEEFRTLYTEKELSKLNRLSKSALKIDNSKSRPSIFFYYLIGLGYKEFKLILEDTVKFIQLLDRINSAVYIFIDKVEQAFSQEINKITMAICTIFFGGSCV